MFSDIRRHSEFSNKLKKLKKKFGSLEDDLKVFEDTPLKLKHKLKKDIEGIEQISGLGIEYPPVFKVTKFACKALKGKGSRSGIRITYAYLEEEDIIEYIEIYHKSDKENEDRGLIKKYYKK